MYYTYEDQKESFIHQKPTAQGEEEHNSKEVETQGFGVLLFVIIMFTLACLLYVGPRDYIKDES